MPTPHRQTRNMFPNITAVTQPNKKYLIKNWSCVFVSTVNRYEPEPEPEHQSSSSLTYVTGITDSSHITKACWHLGLMLLPVCVYMGTPRAAMSEATFLSWVSVISFKKREASVAWVWFGYNSFDTDIKYAADCKPHGSEAQEQTRWEGLRRRGGTGVVWVLKTNKSDAARSKLPAAKREDGRR